MLMFFLTMQLREIFENEISFGSSKLRESTLMFLLSTGVSIPLYRREITSNEKVFFFKFKTDLRNLKH